MPLIRLNKYLASLGVASRRKIDEFVVQKRILVNNELAELGDKVDPEVDRIQIDKRIIAPHPQKLVYYALNKPPFVVSTSSDPQGRETVIDLVPSTPRVFPVGRLDYQSTGLILLTNDGNLALKLTHPKFHLPKVYLIQILGRVPLEKIKEMNVNSTQAELVEVKNNQTTIKITLHEGKKRQIRLMCAGLHLHLMTLHRISIGPITIGNLPIGQYRDLTLEELRQII